MPATTPPTLTLESPHGAEFRQLVGRIGQWRDACPAVFLRFWDVATQGVRCILCGKSGAYLWETPEGVTVLNVSVYTAPESAARRAIDAGGPHAIHYVAVSADETWFGWCTRCAAPTTAEGWDAVVDAVQRRAAKP